MGDPHKSHNGRFGHVCSRAVAAPGSNRAFRACARVGQPKNKVHAPRMRRCRSVPGWHRHRDLRLTPSDVPARHTKSDYADFVAQSAESLQVDVHVHFFNPSGIGDWWITEGSREGDDFIMFGLCDLGFPELGYVSLNELKAVSGPLGLGIERDLHWRPQTLREVREELGRRQLA